MNRTDRSEKYISSAIAIGSVPLGGNNPIRVQSMTNTNTLATEASVAQCIRIIEAGADYVRLTAQGIREAENLNSIKRELRKAGFNTPLIADIHFNPLAAETAARIVEKVRINPGNYVDKRASFSKLNLTEKEYAEEIERSHTRLLPLINICRENNTVIRIGINHGSLSDRIMSRFGNTPAGMVASAEEFISIFRAENFHNLVLSMKSSDTSVMIEATRMLVRYMINENIAYPVHLGVTEAGEGEDGRIKSAAGIGALLSEGIGDTIRVSLSEPPENEIPVALRLTELFPRNSQVNKDTVIIHSETFPIRPDIIKKVNGPVVISDMRSFSGDISDLCKGSGFIVNKITDAIERTYSSADIILLNNLPENVPENVTIAIPYELWQENKVNKNILPVFTSVNFSESIHNDAKLNIIIAQSDTDTNLFKNADPKKTLVLFSYNFYTERYSPQDFLKSINENNLNLSIILNPHFRENDLVNLQITASSLIGKYVIDKNVGGISITNEGSISSGDITATAFSILQCTETRITRTMYLSCPTCGRTKFNLPDAVRRVKEATGHLKGIKIAIMGCIVNGPGEMAGADYGYVGAAEGKVHIYKGMRPVLKNISEEEAVKELLRIIENDLAK
jgi:(E)-4-hydroxy-3-methylbut-2-enyl-diphosphate synthase